VAMTAKDVESDTGDEVLVRIQRCFLCTLARVGECRTLVGLLRDEMDVECEIQRKGETQDVKARANVGRGGRDFDAELGAKAARQSNVVSLLCGENQLTFRSAIST
jgi:hypothetical protein